MEQDAIPKTNFPKLSPHTHFNQGHASSSWATHDASSSANPTSQETLNSIVVFIWGWIHKRLSFVKPGINSIISYPRSTLRVSWALPLFRLLQMLIYLLCIYSYSDLYIYCISYESGIIIFCYIYIYIYMFLYLYIYLLCAFWFLCYIIWHFCDKNGEIINNISLT